MFDYGDVIWRLAQKAIRAAKWEKFAKHIDEVVDIAKKDIDRIDSKMRSFESNVHKLWIQGEANATEIAVFRGKLNALDEEYKAISLEIAEMSKTLERLSKNIDDEIKNIKNANPKAFPDGIHKTLLEDLSNGSDEIKNQVKLIEGMKTRLDDTEGLLSERWRQVHEIEGRPVITDVGREAVRMITIAQTTGDILRYGRVHDDIASYLELARSYKIYDKLTKDKTLRNGYRNSLEPLIKDLFNVADGRMRMEGTDGLIRKLRGGEYGSGIEFRTPPGETQGVFQIRPNITGNGKGGGITRGYMCVAGQKLVLLSIGVKTKNGANAGSEAIKKAALDCQALQKAS